MLQEKVVVVAGTGPGNGAALTRRVASEGPAVAMPARSKEHADALAAEIVGARGFACDVGDEASVKAGFAAIAADRSGRRVSPSRSSSTAARSTVQPRVPECRTNQTNSLSTLRLTSIRRS